MRGNLQREGRPGGGVEAVATAPPLSRGWIGMYDFLTTKAISVCGIKQPAGSRIQVSDIDALALCFACAGLPMKPPGWQLLAGEAVAGIRADFDGAGPDLLQRLQLPAFRWAHAQLLARGIGCLSQSTVSPAADDCGATFPQTSIVTTREVTIAGATYPAQHEVRASVSVCCLPVMDGSAQWLSAADEQLGKSFVVAGGLLHAIGAHNGQLAPVQAASPAPLPAPAPAPVAPSAIDVRIVSMPDRVTESSIDRDPLTERITRSVQVERDAA